MVVVKVQNLVKSYKGIKVLDGIDFLLEKGKIYGLVGLNGAGKTVLMNILAGVILPESGSVEILGQQDSKKSVAPRNRMGFLIEEPIFYPNLDARENLRLVQLVKGKEKKEEIEQVLSMVGLDGINERKKALKAYSLGMRQRYGIAVALIGSPEILILDEPTNGLDIEGLKEMRKLLEELRNSGVTMLISSHILGDLYKIAEEFLFLKKGHIVGQWNHKEVEERLDRGEEIEELFSKIIGE